MTRKKKKPGCVGRASNGWEQSCESLPEATVSRCRSGVHLEDASDRWVRHAALACRPGGERTRQTLRRALEEAQRVRCDEPPRRFETIRRMLRSPLRDLLTAPMQTLCRWLVAALWAEGANDWREIGELVEAAPIPWGNASRADFQALASHDYGQLQRLTERQARRVRGVFHAC